MRTDFTTGALVASLAAGPILLVPVTLLTLLFDYGAGYGNWTGVPIVLVLATLFGFVIALMPNLVGAAVLARLGERRRGFRHPAVWTPAGFVFGWLLAFAAFREADMVAVLIGVDGAVCALISRRFVGWAT